MSRAWFYTLAEDCRPESVMVGRRVIITESPAAWLARMKARGGVPKRKATVTG